MKKWNYSNVKKNDEYIGQIEFQSNDEEWHHFYIFKTKTRLVFGGVTNIGFSESGYMPFDDCFTIDENLEAMVEELKDFYNNGKQTETLILTERM